MLWLSIDIRIKCIYYLERFGSHLIAWSNEDLITKSIEAYLKCNDHFNEQSKCESW